MPKWRSTVKTLGHGNPGSSAFGTLCVYSHPGQGHWGALHLVPSWTLPPASLPWDYFRLYLVRTTTITKTTLSEVYDNVWVIIKTENDFENALKYQLVLEVKVVLRGLFPLLQTWSNPPRHFFKNSHIRLKKMYFYCIANYLMVWTPQLEEGRH